MAVISVFKLGEIGILYHHWRSGSSAEEDQGFLIPMM
jgi:hypothetical protein